MNDIRLNITIDGTPAEKAIRNVDAAAGNLAATAAKLPAAFNAAFRTPQTGSISDLTARLAQARQAVENMLPGTQLYDVATRRLTNVQNLLAQAQARTATSMRTLQTATGNGNFALMSFGRIVQDMPYGFMAIGNNITQFAESFAMLKQQAGSTAGALKTFAQTLMGGGGVMLAINLAVTALTYLSMSSRKSEESTTALSLAQDAEFQRLIRNKQEFNSLMQAVMNAKESKDEAVKAAAALTAKYTSLIGNTNLLTASQDALAAATRRANAELDKQIRKRAAEKVLDQKYEDAYTTAAELINVDLEILKREADKKTNPEKYQSEWKSTQGESPSERKSQDQIDLQLLYAQRDNLKATLNTKQDTIEQTNKFIEEQFKETVPAGSVPAYSINVLDKAIGELDKQMQDLDKNAADYESKKVALKNKRDNADAKRTALYNEIYDVQTPAPSGGGDYNPNTFSEQGSDSIADIKRTIDELKASNASWQQILIFIQQAQEDIDKKLAGTLDDATRQRYSQMKSSLIKEQDTVNKEIRNADNQLRKAQIDNIDDDLQRKIQSIEYEYDLKAQKIQEEVRDSERAEAIIQQLRIDTVNKIAVAEKEANKNRRKDVLNLEAVSRDTARMQIQAMPESFDKTIAEIDFAYQEEKSKLVHAKIANLADTEIDSSLQAQINNLLETQLLLLDKKYNSQRAEAYNQAVEDEIKRWRDNNTTANVALTSVENGLTTWRDNFLLDTRQAKNAWDAAWLAMKNTAIQMLTDILMQALIKKAMLSFIPGIGNLLGFGGGGGGLAAAPGGAGTFGGSDGSLLSADGYPSPTSFLGSPTTNPFLGSPYTAPMGSLLKTPAHAKTQTVNIKMEPIQFSQSGYDLHAVIKRIENAKAAR